MRLLQVDSAEEYQKLIAEYDRGRGDLIRELANISFWSRGGVQYNDAWNLTYLERRIFYRMIEDNLERVKKSGLPLA